MRELFFVVLAFAVFNPLQAINFFVNDTTHQYYLNTTLSLTVGFLDHEKQATSTVTIDNGTATLLGASAYNSSVLYLFSISHAAAPSVRWDKFAIEAKKSADNMRRYIEEFEATATFDGTNLPQNFSSGVTLSFVVSPPRFPHFQVKTDWQYNCPVQLSLGLCSTVAGSSPLACNTTEPYKNISVALGLASTLFSGGKEYGHDYSSKTEDCPKSYDTRTDIGIGCIVAFWTIALAAFLWFFVKYLIKRHKNRDD